MFEVPSVGAFEGPGACGDVAEVVSLTSGYAA